MKRLICILLVSLLLAGCGQKVISPAVERVSSTVQPSSTALLTAVPTADPVSPVPTVTPRPALPTCLPKDAMALFPEEVLTQEGDPIAAEVYSLLGAAGLTKKSFHGRFVQLIRKTDALDQDIRRLMNEGRTLTAERKERTVDALTWLTGRETADALQDAYSTCVGEGAELPVQDFLASVDTLRQDVLRVEERTVPLFDLSPDAAREYKQVLARYMGEPVSPEAMFIELEDLCQTEAYAISAALQADPEAARKKVPISLGSFSQNIAFLCKVAQELCPLPDGSTLPVPYAGEKEAGKDLFELAFRYYPGLAFLRAYAEQAPEEQRVRWANAPYGYGKGLAVHASYAVIPYLEVEDFGLDYLQYRWYEEMLTVTLTGITALLIHYYGYSAKDLAAYLQSWGAADYTGYLYDRAMSDPFQCLTTAYGYHRYLEICQAALDAGCDSEERFLRDYLAAGPAPFEALKEYMVNRYQKQG